MADRYLIRHARPADLPGVVAIEGAVFTDPWSPGMLRSSLSGVAFVAEDRVGDVVGYLFAVAIGAEGEILNLAVHPAHRRRGIARELTELGCDALAEVGVRRVFLEVRASNRAAQRFYDAMGFRQVGRRPGYYCRPREDALLLARDLRPESGLRRTGQNGVSLIDKRT